MGTNVEKVLPAQGRGSFAARMAVVSRKARENNYWLRLLRDGNICPSLECQVVNEDSEELIRLLASIAKTSQLNVKCQAKNLRFLAGGVFTDVDEEPGKCRKIYAQVLRN